MKQELKQYPLKINKSLFDKLVASSEKNDRSVNKEIAQAIKHYLKFNIV